MALVLDTGPLLAALDLDDRDHEPCAELLSGSHEPLVVPAPILVEVDYWLRKRHSLGVLETFVEDLQSGAYRIEHLDPSGISRAVEIERQYEDLDLGFVDAAVITICELLGEEKVATLDQRHFGAVRPSHCRFLQLLPELS